MAIERVRVVLNSAGQPIEAQASDGNQAATMAALPPGEFTDAQALLAGISMPFRKLIRDPFLCPVGLAAATTPIDRVAITDKSCTSFQVVNANPFWVRLRGCTGPDDNIREGEGWLWPPGFVGVYSTQYPDFVSSIAVARPRFPITDASGAFLYPGARLELSYGIGGE
jgi:hypothetical protein